MATIAAISTTPVRRILRNIAGSSCSYRFSRDPSDPAFGLCPEAPLARRVDHAWGAFELLLEGRELGLVAPQPCGECGELGLQRRLEHALVGSLLFDPRPEFLDRARARGELGHRLRDLPLQLLDAPGLAVPRPDGQRRLVVAPRLEAQEEDGCKQDHAGRVHATGRAAYESERAPDSGQRQHEDERAEEREPQVVQAAWGSFHDERTESRAVASSETLSRTDRRS